MSNYVAGDRVWVLVEGYDWWPARVLSDEELRAVSGARRAGCDVAVVFYRGTVTEPSVYELNSVAEATHICYFETSSEKAVTNNEDLRAAINNAATDESANVLKTATVMVASGTGRHERGHAGPSSTGAATNGLSGGKRTRSSEGTATMGGRDAYDRGGASAKSYISLPIDTLRQLAQDISDAVRESDVAALRVRLCELDGVDVLPAELERSKIGVAVGNILGNRSCQPLWPLARALISFWARHLSQETLKAIRSLQESSAHGHAKLRELASPHSPSSPARFSSPTSPMGGPASPTTTSQRRNFFTTLCRLLDNPANTTRVPTSTVETVARELVKGVVAHDDRALLLSRLDNPELGFVRANLLCGRWTAQQYLEQPEEVFKTEKEKAEEMRRLRRRIEAEESAKMANVNLTTLFTCPSCHKNRCHYYEQQTRSADEPTTKFITCLECKHTWTQE